MKSIVYFALVACTVSLKLFMNSQSSHIYSALQFEKNKFPKNINTPSHNNKLDSNKSSYGDTDYEIPQWAKQRFKKNKIPKFSEYNKKKRNKRMNTYISEEDAHYNAIEVCNLPYGLLQK